VIKLIAKLEARIATLRAKRHYFHPHTLCDERTQQNRPERIDLKEAESTRFIGKPKDLPSENPVTKFWA